MPAGRPQEYKPEMVEKVKQYMLLCQDEENQKLPNKGGLAVYLDVARETIYDWCSKFPDFSDIVEKLFSMQEDSLINNGITGRYNASITKVILTKHGYREGIDTTTNDKDLPTPILGNAIPSNNSTEEDSKS